MDRMARILRGIDKSMLGIEVAPWFAPIASKATGYNVRILDVFDRDALLARAKVDPNLIDRDMGLLEDVDYVGSATEIATIIPQQDLGTFDYIVSSHNFEHLPNPIKFLQGCAKVLKPGGVLSIAVPDRRGCFDYFRPNATIGDWLDAYETDRKRPTQRQVFDYQNQRAYFKKGEKVDEGFFLGVPTEAIFQTDTLAESFERYYKSTPAAAYEDAHCTVMTPASFELLLTEAQYLGLINCRIVDISPPAGSEFFVQLRFGQPFTKPSEADFRSQRLSLHHRVLQDYAPQVLPDHSKPRPKSRSNDLSRKIRRFGRFLRGKPDH